MRKYLIIIVIIILSFPSLSFAKKEVVKLCNDPWPPYVEGKMGESPTGGFAVNIVRKIFERIEGVDLEITLTPWKRCLKSIEQGTMEGYVQGLYNDERSRYLVTSDPAFVSGTLFYYRISKHPNGIDWQTFGDLSKYEVGDVIGYSTSKEWTEAIESKIIKVQWAKTEELNFKKLLKGRIDLTPHNEQIAEELIKKHKAEGKIGHAKKPLKVTLYRMSLGKKSPHLHLLPQINQVIGELKAEGVIDEIMFAGK